MLPLSKGESKRPSDDTEGNTDGKVKKVKIEHESPIPPKGEIRPRETNSDKKTKKKIKIDNATDEWDLGKGYEARRIFKLRIQKQEFFDYIASHKALSTSNLLDIRGYGNLTELN